MTIFVTGALTALGVIATALLAFQLFEHETAYHRADMFLQRVVAMQTAVLTPDCPAPVAAVDIELFERAVANLVDNALKFSGDGDRIVLSACRKDAQVEVVVADSGPGIAAVELPHPFDRFYQSRATVAPATGEGGKGLGLAIVKRIAELHGGEVSVHSTPGAGTQVMLLLPAVGP